MPVEVILPKVDMDMTTGRISRWLVAEGADVKKGDALFEIETDKAAMEVESPGTGKLEQVTAREGDDIPIGQVVAWIFAEGEAPAGAGAPSASQIVKEVKEVPAEPAAIVENQHGNADPRADGVRATPLARRLAKQKGVDLSAVSGSGPRGRILSADIEALAAKTQAVPVSAAPVKQAAAPQSNDAGILALYAEGSFSQIPHDNMRKTIARRLTESKSAVPHFYLSADCRLDALLKLRSEVNAAAPVRDGAPSYRLSINDFVIKAWALALRDVPDANVSWTDAAMLRHTHADIGVAVSIEGGLITPIIRQAELKSLSAISNQMKDLAARAKSRKLKPEEYNGGSSAISNLGMFGVRDFAAIINPPHATILAVGSGDQRPIVENGVIAAATVMTVTLSTDHRAVDGALGAEAMAAFKRCIEHPLAMLT